MTSGKSTYLEQKMLMRWYLDAGGLFLIILSPRFFWVILSPPNQAALQFLEAGGLEIRIVVAGQSVVKRFGRPQMGFHARHLIGQTYVFEGHSETRVETTGSGHCEAAGHAEALPELASTTPSPQSYTNALLARVASAKHPAGNHGGPKSANRGLVARHQQVARALISHEKPPPPSP